LVFPKKHLHHQEVPRAITTDHRQRMCNTSTEELRETGSRRNATTAATTGETRGHERIMVEERNTVVETSVMEAGMTVDHQEIGMTVGTTEMAEGKGAVDGM